MQGSINAGNTIEIDKVTFLLRRTSRSYILTMLIIYMRFLNDPVTCEVQSFFSAYVSQVVAIVMDLLTDLQILQDLLDAASKRGVAVYIILDNSGAPHFLDMCSRLMVGAEHLQVSRKLFYTLMTETDGVYNIHAIMDAFCGMVG